MIEDVKDWVRARAGKVLVCSTGTLLALSLLSLALALLADGSADADAKADQLIVQLQGKQEDAQSALETKHARLLAALPGMDAERADRDRAAARSVLLSLTDSSAASRTVKETQAALDARYAFLGTSSRILTEFIPEWMAATGAGKGAGTAYQLADFDVDVAAVKGLDYSYIGVARLDPVSADGKSTAKSEYVVFTFATGQDGTVASFEAYRASGRTRDQLVAQRPPASASPAETASPGPSHSG
ncbi:hypothetical protein M8J71_16385 [Pseudarthrobacter sp. R1]|uniref:hypothetical protein n=1 Tax=Pseudarthrobacter sp. R1 TaxID=2944934 RepID=UPI00210B42C2|nr:hypothetical protein [Pseudarthrobacter sp. R1]MCQ6272050.1 hypothetical protein [Pseudarthrobacter sp. R1]